VSITRVKVISVVASHHRENDKRKLKHFSRREFTELLVNHHHFRKKEKTKGA